MTWATETGGPFTVVTVVALLVPLATGVGVAGREGWRRIGSGS